MSSCLALKCALLRVEIDDLTKKLVRSLRSAGSPISTDVVLASAKGIVAHKNVSLLKEHGGHIDLDKSWAKSFLTRLGYVKRKVTCTARKIPPDFPEVKAFFFNKVAEAVSTFHIPPTMVVNCDQTGSKMVLVNPWSLAAEGSKQVAVVGLDDKREITVLLSVSLDGQLLPPQVIYAGKTPRCHPSVVVPPGWYITHSQNHWSTEETMIEFIEKVFSPYMATERQHMQLPGDTFGLCLWDVFAVHRCQSVLKKLGEHVKVVFIPAGCTGMLQPLDISINDPFKRHLKQKFGEWYAEEVKSSLDSNVAIEDIKVDMKTSRLKPIHFQWLVRPSAGSRSSKILLNVAFLKQGSQLLPNKYCCYCTIRVLAHFTVLFVVTFCLLVVPLLQFAVALMLTR